jgi:hypothetical protein
LRALLGWGSSQTTSARNSGKQRARQVRVLSNLSLHTIHHILEAQHTWPHCNLVRAAAPCVAHCLQHLHFQEASHENHGPEKAVRNQQEKRILENTCPVLVGQPSGVRFKFPRFKLDCVVKQKGDPEQVHRKSCSIRPLIDQLPPLLSMLLNSE